MKDDVIRISIGRFDPNKTVSVKLALEGTHEKLAPGIRLMAGIEVSLLVLTRKIAQWST